MKWHLANFQSLTFLYSLWEKCLGIRQFKNSFSSEWGTMKNCRPSPHPTPPKEMPGVSLTHWVKKKADTSDYNVLEKRTYASRISDLGENIIRPQNALNVYHLTARTYWLVLKKAIHRVFSCKTVSPQDSSCYLSRQRRLGAKCNSLLTGNVASEITKDNWEWGCVTLPLFGLVPSSTSVECMYQYCIGFFCFREILKS